jgi:hypothetical protein
MEPDNMEDVLCEITGEFDAVKLQEMITAN